MPLRKMQDEVLFKGAGVLAKPVVQYTKALKPREVKNS